jgi:hypothetical protein
MLWATLATDVQAVAQDSPILVYGGLAVLVLNGVGTLLQGTGTLLQAMLPTLEAIRRWRKGDPSP